MPLPICVLKNGIPVRRTKLAMPWVPRGRLEAAPNMISGRFALMIISAARSSAVRCATGISIGWTGTTGTSGTSSPAMSSGNSRCTGPGRSSIAVRKASRTSVGIEAALTICRVILVSGFIEAMTSTIWKRAWRLLMIAFWPVMITIGMAPRWA